MDILVLIKRVPETGDADLQVDGSGRAIVTDDLAFGANEWDDYAVEEAVRLKEAHGGSVTVLTVGDEDDEEVLRRALAMGADDAVRVEDAGLAGSDPLALARVLAAAASERAYDLVLCGAVSSDGGHGQVGGLLAGLLDRPFVALATAVAVADDGLEVRHEVEGGLERVVAVALPAVISVQTGINEPRYVSIRGIRKVAGVEIPVRDLAALGVDPAAVGDRGSRLRLETLEPPPAGAGAELLEGDPETVAEAVVQRLRERGGL